MAASKKRIAILGGGVGSLSTAFALTSQPGWQQHYEITIYQLGWRLGGKGASGRNRDQDKQHRVEEHGFHVWLGFYDNAFKMIKETYAELARQTGPLRTWQDAFKKHSLIVLEEQHNGQRKRWQVDFPTGPREPGTVVQLGLIGYAARMFRLLSQRLPDTRSKQNERQPLIVRLVQRAYRTIFLAALLLLTLAQFVLRLAERRVERRVNEARRATAAVAATLNPVRRLLGMMSRACRAAIEALTALVITWAESADASDEDDARRMMIFFDLGLAILRGIIVDDVMANGFESIDHVEFREWLRSHNARPETIDSALIKSIYDGNFCYTKGDRSKPNFAAGVALHCYLRIFLDYKGAFLYKMQAGMGDVVIAPLYLLLKKRGVQFKFFHKVDRLVYDHARQEITAIEMTEQVALTGEDYDPLIQVNVDGGGMECWPSAPKFELIRDGDALERSGINLESQWAATWKDSRPKTLMLGEGKDYDQVVLGISIGGLPGICSELVAHRPEWRRMIENVDTVATQAMQLWLVRDVSTLGWPLESPLVVSFEDPCPNWLDASQVIPNEMLTPDRVRSVAYFCSALADPPVIPPAGPHTYPQDQLLIVQQAHQHWLHQHCGHLWPAFVTGAQLGVNWDMLHDGLDRDGQSRLEWQYFRANVEPSDRFVASSAGATQYRLSPGGSGVRNLFLAGDWTRNGLNAGCIEATVFSGFVCSREIAGYPARIMGEHPFGFGLGGR